MAPQTDAAGGDASRPARRQPAPYIAYHRLTDLIAMWRHGGVPDAFQLDDFTALSSREAARVGAALGFLGLINAAQQPSEQLRRLVEARSRPAWQAALRTTLRQAYPPLFHLHLETCGVAEFGAAFDRAYGGSDGVRRKSRTFFLHAARDAGVPLAPILIRSVKPRGARRSYQQDGESGPPSPGSDSAGRGLAGQTSAAPEPSLSTLLVARLDTRTLTLDQEEAYWKVVRLLKERGL